VRTGVLLLSGGLPDATDSDFQGEHEAQRRSKVVTLGRKADGPEAELAPTSAAEWSHIGAVVFLDYLRGADRLL
jgi:hypothetical protein